MCAQDPTWEQVYESAREDELPWFTSKLDPDVDQVLKDLKVGPQDGPVLDLGTGPGTFAIELAKRGFHVVACDISPSAIRMAMRRAGGHAARIEWVSADLFACSWPKRFQLVHDRGVYHSLPTVERQRYAVHVPPWLRPGAHLIIKTFHQDEPGNWGPNRIPKQELEENFGRSLETVQIAPSTFPGILDHSPKAWLAVFRSPRPTS